MAALKGWKAIIDANKHLHSAYLVTGPGQGHCIKGWQKAAVRGRDFKRPPGPLPTGPVNPRCTVGIILCDGDDLTPVMQWIQQAGIKPSDRIFIMHPPGLDLVKHLAPWYAVFRQDPLSREVAEWPGKRIVGDSVCQEFLNHLNEWIVRDSTGLKP